MKLKNILLSGLSLVLVAALAIGGTVAYLQDDDSDVNVMTLGNVSIEQIEQERDADGNLVDFTQAKPLYPAVYSNGALAFDDDGLYINGENHQVCDASVKNVLDKIVTVKNTGMTDAYMRTVIALECPEGFDGNLIGLNVNTSAYKVADHCYIEVDGNRYEVYTLTHKAILEAGVVSEPSLLQVWLSPTATNEDVEVLDGNGNGTYDILVLSQAVQAAGFADAKTALDTAFGKTSEKAAEWFGGESFPTMVATQEQLDAAVAAGEDVILGVGTYSVSGDTEIVIEGSGAGTVVDIDGNIQNASISNATVVGTNSLNVQADDNVTFTNVVFEGKVGIVEQGVVNGNATFVGCTFKGGLHIDKSAADSEIKFIDCDFGELCIIKLGGSANYSFEDCVIETLDTANTSGWGRAWVISYSDISFTDCQIGRTIRAGGAINVVLDGCVDANGDAVTASIVATNNNPTVTVK